MRSVAVAVMLATTGAASLQQAGLSPEKSYRLENLTWVEAEQVLRPDAIVVLPVGAASKEHGPHLKLRNDFTLAEHLTARVAAASPVVIAPTLTYHYYPAFLEYPGSTSLSLNTARDLTADVIRSLARYGPRRFYVLNTGVSTARPLASAAQALATDGILLRYTNLEARLDEAARGIREQEGGSHADEIETSMMLYIDRSSVDMTRAIKDYAPRSTPFALTRRQGAPGTFSPSGIWGDPTRATAEKGRSLTEILVAGILDDIAALRTASPPTEAPRPSPLKEGPPGPTTTAPQKPEAPVRCTEGDLRAIAGLGDAFTAHWTNGDAERLGALWADGGDIAHPDGAVERTAQVITQNRTELFRRREYRGSRHPLQVGNVRCIANEIAVADGKWELRGVTDTKGKPLPVLKGLCTLVVQRNLGTWKIQAYRYTIDPAGPVVPTLLKRPGYPGGPPN